MAQADGDKNSTASRQQQQKKQQQQEAAREEACPVRTIKKILRPATLEELEQLQQKVRLEITAQLYSLKLALAS